MILDKNGKEIREGDTLIIPDTDEIYNPREPNLSDHILVVTCDPVTRGLAVDTDFLQPYLWLMGKTELTPELGFLVNLQERFGKKWEILRRGDGSSI